MTTQFGDFQTVNLIVISDNIFSTLTYFCNIIITGIFINKAVFISKPD